MFRALVKISRLLILLVIVCPAHSAKLKCFNGTLGEYISVTLDKPLAILSSTCINENRPTVIYTFGYRGKSAGPATTAVLTAYLATKKKNVLLLDWEKEAYNPLLGMTFGYVFFAVPNAKRIGSELGAALVSLARGGINMTRVHLVGHSLGAHIMGYAGRRARQGGYTVPRITGLDPARALFEGVFASRRGLDHTSATFVDIIHTDPGNYGIHKSMGTVDIWPNYGGDNTAQPGCPAGSYATFSPEDLCNHDRSWKYLVEAISSPVSFPAANAPTYRNWVERSSQDPSFFTYLGELANLKLRGNFFLTTNSKPPYGRGLAGMIADANELKRRRRRTPSLTMRLLNLFR